VEITIPWEGKKRGEYYTSFTKRLYCFTIFDREEKIKKEATMDTIIYFYILLIININILWKNNNKDHANMCSKIIN
jgi:hypothetical protein